MLYVEIRLNVELLMQMWWRQSRIGCALPKIVKVVGNVGQLELELQIDIRLV